MKKAKKPALNKSLVGSNADGMGAYCKCGHKHSEHNPISSVNYSSGRCTVGECRCKYFIHQKI